MTDIAARTLKNPRFHLDHPTLERRSGARLRDFSAAATRPEFIIAAHLAERAGSPYSVGHLLIS